jgi:hypothetical protein
MKMLSAFIGRFSRWLRRALPAVGFSILALGLPVVGQTQTPSPLPQSDDVLRINTELQTDVWCLIGEDSSLTV